MEKFERTIKALWYMARQADEAALAAELLDDKVRFKRVANQMNELSRQLRAMYFEYEDCTKTTLQEI